MKSTRLIKHIAIALTLSCLAVIINLILLQFFPSLLSSKINLSLMVFFYLGYINLESPLSAGKITLFTFNLLIVLICFFTVAQETKLLLLYLTLIWLNRSLLFYSSVFAVLTDLGLCLISIGTANWIFINSQSQIIALWCFLLLQALHTLVPVQKATHKAVQAAQQGDNFDRALQSAEEALQQIFRKI